MGNEIQRYKYEPENLADAKEIAVLISKSDLAPATYKGNPANVFIAVMMGAELGLSPMQSVQGIAVINGKPSVYGDALLALVQGHPDCEDVIEEKIEHGYRCTIKRRGRSVVVREFTMADAKTAGLLNKQGPWTTYPARMCQMRARGFALRDAFADVLRGVITAEEAADIPRTSAPKITGVESVKTKLDAMASKEQSTEEIDAIEETKCED